jgi:hypothetical protein
MRSSFALLFNAEIKAAYLTCDVRSTSGAASRRVRALVLEVEWRGAGHVVIDRLLFAHRGLTSCRETPHASETPNH